MVSLFFFFKQKTAYEIKECDWSSDVCSSDLPIAGHRELAAFDDERMTGLELAHIAVHRFRRRDVLRLEVQAERLEVGLARYRRVGAETLQLGGEDERAAVPLVIERLHADMVARDEEALRRPVPQREGEHALQVLEHAHAVFAIGIEEGPPVAPRGGEHGGPRGGLFAAAAA